jgi:tRNA threonylcarbamoyladenosine biosynthesis protein TsaE
MSIIHSRAPEDTEAAGETLGRLVQSGDVVALTGDLGAGKTLFVRGLARGLGVPERRVTSPSFTLVNEYRGGRLPLYHVDLYRLEREAELEDIGLDDLYRQEGVAVEWPERVPGAAPAERLEVTIRFAPGAGAEAREIEAQGRGARAEALAREWGVP